MDNLTTTILAAVEHTAMSGLCHEEQLEIGVQEAHERRLDLSDDVLLELAKEVNEFFESWRHEVRFRSGVVVRCDTHAF